MIITILLLPLGHIPFKLGYILIFKFNGVDEFAVKFYDGYNWRKTYYLDSDDEFDDSDEENM
jgi:hypothetical protein